MDWKLARRPVTKYTPFFFFCIIVTGRKIREWQATEAVLATVLVVDPTTELASVWASVVDYGGSFIVNIHTTTGAKTRNVEYNSFSIL